MATILRDHTRVEHSRRAYHQIDIVRNAIALAPKSPPVFASTTEPDRFWPKPPVQDFMWAGTTTQGIPARARDPNIFRAPTKADQYRRPYQQIEQQPSLTLKTLAPIGSPPFTLEVFPEIFRRNYGEMLGYESQSFLDGPALLPFTPADFPTPMRAKAAPQDFFQSSVVVPPPKPFTQSDWPLSLRRPLHHQDFWWSGTTTRGIPFGIVEPFNLNDWPVPMRAKLSQSDSYASPRVLLSTPVVRPFSQNDFPNPFNARRMRDDWVWPGTGTRGIPPIPASGQFEAVHLEGYGIDFGAILLRWSASVGASGYRLYINGVPQPAVILQRFTIVTGLAIATPYVFNIVVVNSAGVDASILSNPVYFEHGTNEIGTYHTRPWN